jgi:sortase B
VNQELAAFAVVPEASRADSGASADAVPLPPEVDWAGLRAVNPEAVAWLQVPGTTINYPVYQASDNDRYLRHDAHGEWSVGGQLFMDCDGTGPGMQDQITLVYGHHLRDGSMFEQIAALDDQARFDAVERVWYVTDATAYDCVPLFVCYVHETDETGRSMRFASDEDFHAYVAGRLEGAPAARADASKLADEADHLLFLVTCNYLDEYEGHGRTILACAPRDELESLAAGQG